MALKWNGDKVVKMAQRAAEIGVNQTMAQGVGQAKGNHPWINRTGTAERSIKIIETARRVGTYIQGIWGSASVSYFPVLEFGGKKRKAYPSLFPAARKVYPNLVFNIARAWRSLGGT